MDNTKKIPHRATIKELKNWYNTSYKQIRRWLALIPNLDPPMYGRLGYSRQQIKQIFDHLTPPDQFTET